MVFTPQRARRAASVGVNHWLCSTELASVLERLLVRSTFGAVVDCSCSVFNLSREHSQVWSSGNISHPSPRCELLVHSLNQQFQQHSIYSRIEHRPLSMLGKPSRHHRYEGGSAGRVFCVLDAMLEGVC